MPCRAAARFPLHYKTLTALSLPSKPYYAGIQGSSSDPCRFFNGSVQARGRPASRSSHPPAPLRPRPPGARSAAPSPAAPSRQRTDTKRGSEAPRRAGERPRRGEDPARLSCRRLRGASPTAPTARAPPQPPVRPGRARRSPSATAPPHSTARSDATAAATAASQRGRAVPPGGQSAPCARGSAAAADGRGGAALRCAALQGGPSSRGAPPTAFAPFRSSAVGSAPLPGIAAGPCRGATPAETSPRPLFAPQRRVRAVQSRCARWGLCWDRLLRTARAPGQLCPRSRRAVPNGPAQGLLMVSLVPAESGDDARLSGSVTGGELGGGNGLRRNSGPGRCRAMRHAPCNARGCAAPHEAARAAPQSAALRAVPPGGAARGRRR